MMMKIKQFLMWVGWILLVLGVLGYVLPNIWGASLNFSAGENLSHLLLGLVTLAVAYWAKDADLKRWYVILIGVLALYYATFGWLVSPNYYGYATLEQTDNIIHILIGVWALWAVWGNKKKPLIILLTIYF